jgi:hypothetical protein
MTTGIVAVACLQPNKLGRENREPLLPPLRKSPLEHDIPPLHVPELAQPLAQRFEEVPGLSGRRGHDETDPVRFRSRLRRGNERRGEEPASQGADEPPSVHHSIT